jgi:plasmid stabilization system protein ParE
MSVRVLRRPKAAQDVESIADYIAETSLKAAVRFLENTESTPYRNSKTEEVDITT